MTRVPAAALAATVLCAALLLPAAAGATERPAGAAQPPAAGAKAQPKPKAAAKPRPKPKAQAARPAARAVPGHIVGAPAYGQRDDIRTFAAGVAERRGLDAAWVEQQLAQARRIDSVQKLMMPAPAGTAKDWGAYHDRFVEPRRITAGAAFWQVNADALQRAEARYGVPAALIVGIVGVETYYGRHTGGFRVLDALATLSFDFPSGRSDRSGFFRSELEEFLVLCQREGLDPQVPRGSFAGAMGLPQFMPGSINRHAIDFDGDGRIDLTGSSTDAIGSIAHYLAQFGWQPGMPATFAVTPPPPGEDLQALLGPDILPSFTAAQFAERGALLPPEARAHAGPLALVLLDNGGRPPTYVAGTQNFYAITRYNWSSYYAMAVLALGEAVARAR